MADNETLVTLTADIVAAWVANNRVATTELGEAIRSVHDALIALGTEVEEEPAKPEPAVSVRSSIKPDYLVSLESGKKVKMLKRYLMSSYGMTPEDYRRKWNLPADYPMVAPKYAEQRRALAKKIGLGRKPKAAAEAAPAPAPAPARRGRAAKAS
jgi:predicted transcriptional regulator